MKDVRAKSKDPDVRDFFKTLAQRYQITAAEDEEEAFDRIVNHVARDVIFDAD
ncbi:hypothetical protein [uncultured Tateyamaria sp.]|uniref:hypothetical protein n=1 Tax=uncultured Tateyamaria sp. TaxID=455651 RepID=UPI002627EF2C|nr:hypothetical protein [uncultured Tateyamaria sp.]